MWSLRLFFWLVRRSQYGQIYGFSPVWVRMWSRKWSRLLLRRPQNGQANPSMLTPAATWGWGSDEELLLLLLLLNLILSLSSYSIRVRGKGDAPMFTPLRPTKPPCNTDHPREMIIIIYQLGKTKLSSMLNLIEPNKNVYCASRKTIYLLNQNSTIS